MLNERIEAVRPIAEKLHAAETSLNHSISLLGELISCIPAARSAPGTRMPLTAGMEACSSLAAAVSSAARSYCEVVEAHAHFAEDRDNLGLRTVSWGDMLDCPPSKASVEQETRLRVVKAA